MNTLSLSRCALSVSVAATLLAGCGGSQPPVVTQGPLTRGQMPVTENASRVNGAGQSPRSVHHASVTETVVYSFMGYPSDGANPANGLTYFKGTLYGTTEHGGGHTCHNSIAAGCGTVYSITPSGTETVLHSFTGGLDGAFPEARPIPLNGTLYGTTLSGGGPGRGSSGSCSGAGPGYGTVFSITPSGKERIVHAFFRSREGRWPEAPLLNVNGTMYGTTCGGGGIGDGTAFTIRPSGDEHVITSFQPPGGALPGHGRLFDLNGTLYGTTTEGGTYGKGAVFSLSTSGREKLLHSFNGSGSSKDGAYPVGGLTAINQTLYGTTSAGGAYNYGTVFSITPSGKETVLYSFTYSGGDGANPEATLLNVNGKLYGTTYHGGAYSNDGTVFSITPSGHETVLYNFKGDPDAARPQSGLVNVNGTLYGTTEHGGPYSCSAKNDCGTVFAIKL